MFNFQAPATTDNRDQRSSHSSNNGGAIAQAGDTVDNNDNVENHFEHKPRIRTRTNNMVAAAKEKVDSTTEKSTSEIPKLPGGKKIMDALVDLDVDSVFKSVYENDMFFEIVTSKNYGEVENFEVKIIRTQNVLISNTLKIQVTPWTKDEETGLTIRTMHYEFPKTIAFSRNIMNVNQIQTKTPWSIPGK